MTRSLDPQREKAREGARGVTGGTQLGGERDRSRRMEGTVDHTWKEESRRERDTYSRSSQWKERRRERGSFCLSRKEEMRESTYGRGEMWGERSTRGVNV